MLQKMQFNYKTPTLIFNSLSFKEILDFNFCKIIF